MGDMAGNGAIEYDISKEEFEQRYADRRALDSTGGMSLVHLAKDTKYAGRETVLKFLAKKTRAVDV